MLKGFRDFIARGNVIELAVAVVIGAAFTKVVDSIVGNFINPLIGLAGSSSLEKYTICLKGTCAVIDGKVSGVVIGWGAMISAAITFLLTAAAVYFFIVAPYNRLRDRMNRHAPGAPEPEPTEEVVLLREIRDALSSRPPA
jgi:large conductance mechanosensitive channel